MIKYLLMTRAIGLLLFLYDVFINEDKKINFVKAKSTKKNEIILNAVLISYFFFNVILAEFEIISVILNTIHFLSQLVIILIEKIGTLYFDYYQFQEKFKDNLCKRFLDRNKGDKDE